MEGAGGGEGGWGEMEASRLHEDPGPLSLYIYIYTLDCQ